MDWLGSTWCGNTGCVPGSHLDTALEYPPVVHVGNDGFEIWLGTPDEWLCRMNRADAKRLAFWILFRWWAMAEWFGLRRWLYYKALRRYLDTSQ